MNSLIERLKKEFPKINFRESNNFYWSPLDRIVYFQADKMDTPEASYALMHEIGHSILKHREYESDYGLLKMEIEAWEKAKQIAHKLKLELSIEHIENCLDTYRDWLNKRSICPTCSVQSFQTINPSYYSCFNCHTKWKVSSSRFCRVYRASKNVEQRYLM
jgi:hypothetical protein